MTAWPSSTRLRTTAVPAPSQASVVPMRMASGMIVAHAVLHRSERPPRSGRGQPPRPVPQEGEHGDEVHVREHEEVMVRPDQRRRRSQSGQAHATFLRLAATTRAMAQQRIA